MPDSIAQTAPDPNSIRLPWPLRVAAVLGVSIPIGMLAHLAHQDQAALGQEVETLSEQQVALVSQRDSLASERDSLVTEVEDFDLVRAELSSTNERLDTERELRETLERDVSGLKDKVAVLGEREEALRGIIDLLEGEVVSAERRLAKLSEQRPTLIPELKHLTASAIVASNDPQLRHENDRLRNELSKHDDQVVELLGEISALNQEIEVIREQGGNYSKRQAARDAKLNGAALAGLVGEE